MIHFSFSLNWLPFDWNQLDSGYKNISKNKTFEWELNQGPGIIGIELDWTIKQSHAGVSFGIILCSFEVKARICDNRHWDYINGRWLS